MQAVPHYHFEYGVHDPHTHDVKSHQESRHGDDVKGMYTVLEPDGTTRIVEYKAGKHTGFQATVRYIGHAKHPAHHDKHGKVDHGVAGGFSYIGDSHWGYGSGR